MYIFLSIYTLWVVVQLCVVLRRTGDPVAQWAWIMATLAAPPVASALYALTRTPRAPLSAGEGASAVESIVNAGCATRMREGNRVAVLNGCSEAFAAMIGDLQRARVSIHIEFYILEADRLGSAILSLLRRRARAGVSVKVLCDAYGSRRLPRRLIDSLRSDGVDIRLDTPIARNPLSAAVHCRNHRKMVIIDSRTAHLGGINIANRYLDGDSMGHWYDEQIRLCGTAVADLERLFAADWLRVSGEPLPLAARAARPLKITAGGIRMQVGWSEQGLSRSTIADAVAAMIADARVSLHIVTPYFMPPSWLLDSLRRAALSGVRVRLMLPLQCDSRLVCRIVHSYVAECVRAGIGVEMYEGGFLHSKLLVVDSRRVMVGSANLDYRSMEYNREVVAVIDDGHVAREYVGRFERMSEACRCVTADDVESGRWRCGAGEHLARLLAPLL